MPTESGSPAPRRGLLLVLEGIDGGGKSTLARGIAAALEARGLRVLSTKEPTDGPLGQRIRAVAKAGRETVSAEEELALFTEDRRQHVESLVRPALDAGQVVVQDRSYFSTVAYQGERGLDRARLLADSLAIAPEPDLLLLVDLPPEQALERIRRSRGEGADGFERLSSLTRVREAFRALAKALAPDRVAILDGRRRPEAVLAEALAHIEPKLARVSQERPAATEA